MKTSELIIWNPSEGGWHPSEGGILYLCIACKWDPSKRVWHFSDGGTLYLCHKLLTRIPQKQVHFIYVQLMN